MTSGLAPGQENLVAHEALQVQETLTIVRTKTLAALRNQTKRIQGFTSTFLSDALDGIEGDLNPRFRASERISNHQVTRGTTRKKGIGRFLYWRIIPIVFND